MHTQKNQFVSNIDPSPEQSNNGASDPFCVEGNAIGPYRGTQPDPITTQNGVKKDAAPTGASHAANADMPAGKGEGGAIDPFCVEGNAIGYQGMKF